MVSRAGARRRPFRCVFFWQLRRAPRALFFWFVVSGPRPSVSSFLCAPSYRYCCCSYRERSSISSTSTWEARPARAAGAGTKPAAQLVRRRDIIGIMRDTGSNRARERAPQGRGRGRADRSPRRLVYRPRVRGAEEGVLGDSPKRRVSKLIVFTSTCTSQKRPLRTADVMSEPSLFRR